MATPILATKLYTPAPRAQLVARPRLIAQLNEGLRLGRKLSLVSAPAGFGKSTLVSDWVTTCGQPFAWLSLDASDSDPVRFLTYLLAAVQTMAPQIGTGMLAALQSPQPPPTEAILTPLLNEIAALPDQLVLVLDDYHVIEAEAVDHALIFLIEHWPPQMHLVIATREDPHLPLARLRARGQLTELRAADLRFTRTEAAEFLNPVMGLQLSAADIARLEERTEGWIAGLQLAALSMQGQTEVTGFIQSFTGSHHFVLDYLVEEVLSQQPHSIQTFLLRTSILDRLCGPLCEAVLLAPPGSGRQALEYLEHANLFLVPLDNERRWYRYHHLFAELLRQRLRHSAAEGNEARDVAEYHLRASGWYEANGLEIDAFQHAAAANDIERAARLMEGRGMPLQSRGVMTMIRDWLASLPTTVLDARPLLWVRSATLSLVAGQPTGVEEKLQSAEAAIAAALQGAEPDNMTRDLIGQIATARATLALSRYEPEAMLTQARRALEYLLPDNLSYRFRATWTMGFSCHFRGERAAASRAYAQSLSIAQASGNTLNTILATTGVGQIQELENQLYSAAEAYRHVLQLMGDYSPPSASEAYLGLARICYEWNDLDAAEQHGRQALQLARQYDRVIDRFIFSEVFLAHLKLARDDVAGAAAMLAEAEQSVRQYNFVHRAPEVAAEQVLVLLRQGDLTAAAQLAQTHDLPLSQARVHLAQGHPANALAVLESERREVEAHDWHDERLKVLLLQAMALHTQGEKDQAVQVLGDGLALAQPGGFVRTFVDEGLPMARLLAAAAAQGLRPDYVGQLLAVFEAEKRKNEPQPNLSHGQPLDEPLSQRELEILRLIAQGLSNHEICERLYLALNTVKGHNRSIFGKLQVQRRTEAVARARALGLL